MQKAPMTPTPVIDDSLKPTSHFAIIGAGLAGLSCAIALLQSGFKVSIFEQAGQISEVGAGLQLSGNATHILAQWGLLNRVEEMGFKPQGVRFEHWKNANLIAQFPLNHTVEDANKPYIHIHRADLQTILLAKVLQLAPTCLHLNKQIVKLNSHVENIDIIFADGETAMFDWVLGADGIHSLCKRFIIQNKDAQLGGNTFTDNAFTGNIAWRGLIPTHVLKKKPGAFAHLVMAPNAHLVFYYVKGGAFLNYVAVKETQATVPESWTEKSSLTELLENFSEWHPDYLELLAHSDPEFCYKWALHDRNPLPRWSKERCIILGDAAHPVLPFLAQGAALAIEDAQALAHIFKNHPEKTIQETGDFFYKMRAERCSRVLEASRENMKLYHEKNFIKRFIRDSGARVFSYIYPEFLNKKLDWLYQYRLKQ